MTSADFKEFTNTPSLIDHIIKISLIRGEIISALNLKNLIAGHVDLVCLF